MPPPCPHGDQPDLPLRRLVCMGAILRAEATLLLRLAEVMPQRGLLPRADTAEEPAPVQGRPRKSTLHVHQRCSPDAARLGPVGSHQRQRRVARATQRRGTPGRLWGARACVPPCVPGCAVDAWGVQVGGAPCPARGETPGSPSPPVLGLPLPAVEGSMATARAAQGPSGLAGGGAYAKEMRGL